jgi:hypothetical protein
VTLSKIPLGPAGTVARKIYRTPPNGSSYGLIDTINDNTTQNREDTAADPVVQRAHRALLGLASPNVVLLEHALDPPVRDEPHERDGDVNAERDPAIDERHRNRDRVQRRRDRAFAVGRR